MKVGVFHPGTQHSWQTAIALQDRDRLAWYATSIFYQPERWPYKMAGLLPQPLRNKAIAEFKRFHHPRLDSRYVRTAGIHEWLERFARRAGYHNVAGRLDLLGNIAFGKMLQKLMDPDEISAVWGYDNSSLEVFKHARTKGIKCILDKTIGDPRAYNIIMDELYSQYSEFFLSPNYRIDSSTIDRMQAEYDNSDVILAGCDFAADTIRSYTHPGKVKVVPYCFDPTFFAGRKERRSPRRTGDPINFLFVGQPGPRKGFPLVLKAFARLPKSAARLTVVGDLLVPRSTFAPYSEGVELHGTVTRSGVTSFMEKADCLVFPSFFEGAGLIGFEALACGIGIIQSRNAAIFVADGAGVLLGEITEDSLYEAMMNVIDQPDLIDQWSAAASRTARQFSFEKYRDNVNAVLEDILQ